MLQSFQNLKMKIKINDNYENFKKAVKENIGVSVDCLLNLDSYSSIEFRNYEDIIDSFLSDDFLHINPLFKKEDFYRGSLKGFKKEFINNLKEMKIINDNSNFIEDKDYYIYKSNNYEELLDYAKEYLKRTDLIINRFNEICDLLKRKLNARFINQNVYDFIDNIIKLNDTKEAFNKLFNEIEVELSKILDEYIFDLDLSISLKRKITITSIKSKTYLGDIIIPKLKENTYIIRIPKKVEFIDNKYIKTDYFDLNLSINNEEEYNINKVKFIEYYDDVLTFLYKLFNINNKN